MEQIKQELNAKKQKHDELIKSEKYIEKIKFAKNIIHDFLFATGFYVLIRQSENSLLFNQIDLIFESVVIIELIIKEGAINPIKRELRFIIEAAVKYLYIDTKYSGRTLSEKIQIYDDIVSRSRIDEIEKIDIFAYDEETNNVFANEIKRIYSVLCKYVHPSKDQIIEYNKRVSEGSSIGYESIKELISVSRIIFQVLEVTLIILFQGVGVGYAGDLCVYFFDELKNWKFSKGKYLKIFNSYFNYKYERKNKRT